jgi:multicomponent Na+:H+ antiporter subunit F
LPAVTRPGEDREVDQVLLAVAAFLLANVLLSLVRLVRGPSATDRMVATYLFGTTGVGLFAVLGDVAAERALRDVALVLALLSCVLSAVFAARSRAGASEGTAFAGPDA